MKKYVTLSVLIFLAFGGICQEKEPLGSDPNTLWESLISENSVVGVSAGYATEGETIWQTAAGFADRKSKLPFHEETKVRIASIAKSMTAVAVMQLVEKNLIDLDAPVQRYVPDYPSQYKTQITIRHLLSHSSGLAGYKNAKEAETKTHYPTLSDAVEIFKNRPLLFEPGTQYSYTTYGYTLLGLIIEKVSGLTFEDYMQKCIWDVANMTNTGIDVYGVDEGNSSNLYSRKRKGKLVDAKENNLSNRVPGGGFYSTVVDILKFGTAVINNSFIKAETLDIMRQNHITHLDKNRYGFGWYLHAPKPNIGDVIGHSGAQSGCSSQLIIMPEKGIVVAVLANTSRASDQISNLAFDLLRIASKKL